jgi:hypothetical protein
MSKFINLSFIILVIFSFNLKAQDSFMMDDDFAEDSDTQMGLSGPIVIDPFTSYDQNLAAEEEEEEALERFYTYGRFLQIDAFYNMVYLFKPMANIYLNPFLAGIKVSYFLDWNVAIVLHVGLGEMDVDFAGSNGTDRFGGSAYLFTTGLSLKYYPNFHDVSKYIAFLNPFILFGAEILMINDKVTDYTISGTFNDPSHKVFAPSLFFGCGLEFPIFRKTFYLGGEFLYHLSMFPSENSKIPIGDPNFGHLDYSGTFMTFGGYLKINF